VRILLDESLPRPLNRWLAGHVVSSVTEAGWTSLSNGALLRKAAETFDVLLTADQNIQFQQNLRELPLAVIILVARSNRLESLEPLVPQLLDALNEPKPRTLLRLSQP
jgi:predicted nuclease of predicted toxin-antitoxin system